MLRPFALVMCFALLAGCTKLGTTGGGRGLHPWTKADTVRIGLYEEPDTLNPVITSMSFAGDVFQLLYSGLIRYDGNGHAVPDLARELPTLHNGGISRDGRIITWHLLPNARWSDGVALTSADVRFTWRAIMNPANNVVTRNGYDQILRIETPDPHTVRIVLRRVYPPALFLFHDSVIGAIVPEHILGHLADVNRAPFNSHPVGSGPYVLRAWEHGSQMAFDANPAYFRAAPKIPHAIVKFITNQDTLANELATHEIDVYSQASLQAVQRLRTFHDIRLFSTSTLDWEHLAFNTRKAPLDERAVRVALCHAIDSAEIFAKIYHRLGINAPTHFNPQFGWGDPSLRAFAYDPAAAKAMLDAAGWKLGADGIRTKNGRRLEFTISTVTGVKQRESIEVLLQSAWHAIGADVSVKNYPAPMLFAPRAAGGMLYGGKTDVSLFTWDNVNPDPDDTAFVNSHQLPPAGENVPFYGNPTVDRLEDEGLATYDSAKRHAAYKGIADALIADVPEYVLDFLPSIDAANDDLTGLAPAPVGSDLWNVANWSFAAR